MADRGPTAKSSYSANQERLAARTADKLNPAARAKRDLYVQGLIHGMTKRESAIYAGFSAKSASKEGSNLWCEPYVQEQFRKLREEVDEAELVSRKEVIVGLKREANNTDQGAAHSARVAAWGVLSRVMGYEQAPESGKDATPVSVIFNVRDPAGPVLVTNNGD